MTCSSLFWVKSHSGQDGHFLFMIGVVRKFISTLTLLSVTNGFSIDLNDNELNDGTTKNVTGPLFLNIFDSISNLTMDIDVLFDEFQEGFDDIKAANSSEEENTTEVDDDALNGSSIVVGLFDTLRDITEDVGDVVTDVGEGLADKRPEFIEVTQEVDKKV